MSRGHEEKVEWKSSWVETKPGRLLINYYQRQNRLSMGKINLSPIKNGVGWWETKTKLKNSPPKLSSQACFTPSFPTPSSPPWLGEWGLQSVHHSSCWLLPSTQNFFCSSMWPLPWDSPSQTVPAWALPTGHNSSGTDCSSRNPPQIIPPTRSCSSMGFPEAAGQFLLHFLTPLSQLLHSIFYPFFNIFSQRCHQHHCWAQLWPALSGCVQHGSSPCPFSERPPQQYLLLWKPWHLHPIQDLKPNTWKNEWLFRVS